MLLKALFSLTFATSLFAYLLMWYDKQMAIRQKQRIAESTLWLLGVLFGAAGIWLGMKWPLFHKAGKRSFRVLIPVLLLLQISVLIYAGFFLTGLL